MTDSDITEQELRLLVAVADGSLTVREQETAAELIAARPALQALLAEQRFAVAHARSREVVAPNSLARRIEAERPRRLESRLAPPRARARWGLALGGCVAAAAAVLALLPGAAPGGPTVVEAATLATRPASSPAPLAEPANPRLLTAAEQGVAFPNWTAKFGWRADGARTDELRGRHATTVFYGKQGARIGYTIVAGKALQAPAGGTTVSTSGVTVRYLASNGRLVVTFVRHGHTCILVGPPAKRAVLLTLAGWNGHGDVTF
jgi:hypothetical protein